MTEYLNPDERGFSRPFGQTAIDYAARIASEREIYRNCLDVHNLPEIFHYWSNRYVRPKLETFGFSTPDEMFRKFAIKQVQNGKSDMRRLASLGAGNCDLEVKLALDILDTGCSDFMIDCVDLNPDMLERGRSTAAKQDVAPHINFLQADLNAWSAAHEYDLVIANQSLHHVLNLENLLGEIRRSLKVNGSFVISDIIGRNGHQRWPEALTLVREFWRKLPPSYRFHQELRRYEETYEDWDCSRENFEGIRAQDILQLLIENFHFELFIGFANIIDPFVDRAFGNNFDPAAAWDRSFIDQVNERDETEIASGRISPTHILAVMSNDRGVPTRFLEPLSPEFCLRDPARVVVGLHTPAALAGSAYDWDSWPHSDRKELEIACRRLKEAEDRINQQTSLADERTRWAQRLDREIETAAKRIEALDCESEKQTQRAIRRIEELEAELKERTAWASGLDGECTRLGQQVKGLQQELADRSAWALRLDQELEEQTGQVRRLQQELKERTLARRQEIVEIERLAWARAIDRRLHAPLDYGFRVFRRAVHGVKRMLAGSSV